MANKDIVVLSDFEHVLSRPTVYVGSVEPSDEKLPLIQNSLISEGSKHLSVGMYNILNEAIDNAFDEAKRQNGNLEYIKIEFDSKKNSVSIIDTGGGFKNADKIHPKTGVSNVETAVSMLRAGSNFSNNDIQENIVGTNGMGISLTNMLSSIFEIETTNSEKTYYQKWENFKSVDKQVKKNTGNKTGTRISFAPRKDTFNSAKWDKDYIITQMTFRKWIMSFDPILQSVPFIVTWDGKELDLGKKLFPKEHILINHKVGTVCIYPKFQNSMRASFVNGTQASSTGQRQVHETIIHDIINEEIGYEMAHNFYETVITLNVPPKIMRFGDQNKTRFVTTKQELLPYIENLLKKVRREFKGSEVSEMIQKSIEEYQHKGELKKIRSAKRNKAITFSDKYLPASKTKKRIFICEGQSALGGISQQRNQDTDAIYALKGKIKNVRHLSDLTESQEILNLINILNLDIENKTCDFEEIIIATDPDCIDSSIEVLTSTGPVPISDIVPGDLVLSSDNKTFNRVIDKRDSVHENIIEIIVNGNIIKCSENHVWPVLRNNEIQLIKAIDLTVFDLILFKK